MEDINNNSIEHVNESLTPNDIRVEKKWSTEITTKL